MILTNLAQAPDVRMRIEGDLCSEAEWLQVERRCGFDQIAEVTGGLSTGSRAHRQPIALPQLRHIGAWANLINPLVYLPALETVGFS